MEEAMDFANPTTELTDPLPPQETKLSRADRKALNQIEWMNKTQEEKHQHRANQVPARKPVGTAEGNKQRIQEFKDKLLSAKVGETIIRKLIQVAQDDEHPGQMAALKMCVDRIVPQSIFEDKKMQADRPHISISFSSLGGGPLPTVNTSDIIDQ
jgi:hypothetical protein